MLMGLYHYLQSMLQYVIKDSLTLDEHVAIIFFFDISISKSVTFESNNPPKEAIIGRSKCNCGKEQALISRI